MHSREARHDDRLSGNLIVVEHKPKLIHFQMAWLASLECPGLWPDAVLIDDAANGPGAASC